MLFYENINSKKGMMKTRLIDALLLAGGLSVISWFIWTERHLVVGFLGVAGFVIWGCCSVSYKLGYRVGQESSGLRVYRRC